MPHIPGSPNYEHDDPAKQREGRARTEGLVVAGVFIGDPAAASTHTSTLIARKLSALRYLPSLVDTERVPNARLLRFHLIRLVADAILGYWLRAMPPDQTAAAATFADAQIDDALAAALDAREVPPACSCRWGSSPTRWLARQRRTTHL